MAKFNDIDDAKYAFDNFCIFIPTFNNPTYLQQMLQYFKDRGENRQFIILDNGSTYPHMLDVLDELSGDYHVVMQKENHGPRQIFEEPEVWQELPDYFYITDPDIGLNHDMPDDYEDFLWDILYEYKVFKAGPVLNLTITRPNILDIPIMVAGKETTTRNIELDYYKNELLLSMHADLYPPAYAALIDTTFCLCRKQNIQHGALSAIRCGYPYTAEHYGWWVDPPIPKEEYDFYKEAVKSSQWSSTEATKRGENYVK